MTQAPFDMILLRQLAARLSGKPPPRFKQRSNLGEGLAYSTQFFDAYRRMLAAAIPRKLARTFGWRTFYRLEADETRRHTVADPTLWADMPARFTSAGTDAMWQLLCGQSPALKRCTEWDALVAYMAWPGPARSVFNDAWLHARNAHWIVRAYAIATNSQRDLRLSQRPWWLVYFTDPIQVPFALRFVLIETAGAYYAWAAEQLASAIKRAEAQRFQVPPDVTLPIYDPRHLRYFEWNPGALSQLGFDQVNQAVHCWTHDGMLGFDDDHFIESLCTDVGLGQHQASIRDSLRHFGRVSREL